MPFHGLIIPFGALVTYMPQSVTADEKDSFEPTRVPGIFVGWHMHPGGIWSGDYLVADYVAIKNDIDIGPRMSGGGPHGAKIHRTKEVELPATHLFPIHDMRRARDLMHW